MVVVSFAQKKPRNSANNCVEIGSEVLKLSVAVPIGSGMLREHTVSIGNFSGMAGHLAIEHPHRNGAAPILTDAVQQVIVPAVDDPMLLEPSGDAIELRGKKTQRGTR